MGPDFRFGKGAKGDCKLLRQRGKAYGFKTIAEPYLKKKHKIISSTWIRLLCKKGKLNEARELLGRPISIYGRVVKGEGIGRHLGYPTINLSSQQEILPPDGVYAIRVFIQNRFHQGVLHLGARPTFGKMQYRIEAHLFDFHKDVYGMHTEILLFDKIRSTKRFSSEKDLREQIQRDIKRAKSILSKVV